MQRVVDAIRQIDPKREVVIDGLGGGHVAMPELADLGVIHSRRGHQPMLINSSYFLWTSRMSAHIMALGEPGSRDGFRNR